MKGSQNSVSSLREAGPDLALPEAQDRPPHLLQPFGVVAVPLHVPLNLGDPVVRIGSLEELPAAALPVVAVPEISIAEDGELRPGEHDIRPAGKLFDVLPVSGSRCPEGAPEEELATCVGFLAATPSSGTGLYGGGLATLVAGAMGFGAGRILMGSHVLRYPSHTLNYTSP